MAGMRAAWRPTVRIGLCARPEIVRPYPVEGDTARWGDGQARKGQDDGMDGGRGPGGLPPAGGGTDVAPT